MFNQHPLIPLIFCGITIAVIIRQSLIKRRFLKAKTLFIFLITFFVAFVLVFYKDIEEQENWLEILNWVLLGLDIVIGILLYSTIDFSFAHEKFQKELTKSVDESKYYAVLDKKDKIKDISSLLLADLGIELNEAYGKNFFDILETKYRIIGFNGEECYKEDIKQYYEHYEKKVKSTDKNKIELILQEDNADENAMYFFESLIFSGDKYKGRVLMGEKKSEENLVGMEKDLASASSELELIKNRFVTILEKTSEGIFFNDLSQGYIWCNDTLVKKLSLNGNSLNIQDFYRMIHPEDLPLYEDKMKNLPADYAITYRFNTGASYVYVKEEGHKIVLGKTVELCGIMTPIDNYRFAKTDTVLDTIQGEPEMLTRLSALEKSEKIFEVVYFRVASIPEVNEQCGRAIGNTLLAQYVTFFKQNFVTDNQIYRIGGLDFVAFITDYRKMDMLKNNLMNGEKMLHVHADYIHQRVDTEVYMGIARSDDLPSRKDTLKNAKEALRFCSNPQFSSNFAFYKDIK